MQCIVLFCMIFNENTVYYISDNICNSLCDDTLRVHSRNHGSVRDSHDATDSHCNNKLQ